MVTVNQSPESGGTQILVIALVLGGLLTIAVGVFLGATVNKGLYFIALASLIDFGLAWLYRSGQLGSADAERQEAGSANEQAIRADDPSYNPYARED